MTTLDTPILSLRNIGKRFGGVQALDDVSFDVVAGELHAVMGENGAGKSTLMKILAGVIGDYDGDLYVSENRQHFRSTRDAEAAGVSIIHQELNLVETLSVSANIFLGRESRRWLGVLDKAAMDRDAATLLAQLDSPLDPSVLAGTLRIGDQQLIEIAKALSLRSSILIMDEPTSALTESEVERLYRVIEGLIARGVTILYISHKMDEVFRLADRITVLRDGRFVTTVRKQDTTAREIAHLMVGRELADFDHHAFDEPHRENVLTVRDLSLPWPGHSKPYRLKGIDLTLQRGEILGIAGLMGAGRTELLECLCGASPVPPHGEILVEGTRCRFDHPADAMAAGIAMVTEDRKRLGLFRHMNVRENISLCAIDDCATAGVVSKSSEIAHVASQVNDLAIRTDGTECPIDQLSGGNQQKCIIARCLLTRPKILLLDDPTRGVDVGAKAELYRLIRRLAGEGMSIIVTSSELPELLTLADRIAVMCEGVITQTFDREHATEQGIMEAATRTSIVSLG